MCALLSVFLFGCGGGGGGDDDEVFPDTYVGVFKSIRSTNDQTVIVTITKDDGVHYEGTIDTLTAEGVWGEPTGDALGIVTYQLTQGYDTNFLDFYLNILGTEISGTALRQ